MNIRVIFRFVLALVVAFSIIACEDEPNQDPQDISDDNIEQADSSEVDGSEAFDKEDAFGSVMEGLNDDGYYQSPGAPFALITLPEVHPLAIAVINTPKDSNKIRQAMPELENKAHSTIWKMPKVQDISKRMRNREVITVTWVRKKPNKEYPYYHISLNQIRSYGMQTLRYFRVNTENNTIEIRDKESMEFVPAENWF